MSLKRISLQEVAKKQYLFKLKSYFGVFGTLMLLQVIAMVFALNGSSMYGTGSDQISMTIRYFSADMMIAFTLLWGFITSVLITTRGYRYDDFTFIANRLSSHLANIAFLVTISVFGGMTSMLSGFALKSILYYFRGFESLKTISLLDAPFEVFVGIGAAILYVLLVCAVGYFVGMLAQFHKILVLVIPAAGFGSLYIGAGQNEPPFILSVLNKHLFTESSFSLFAAKIIIISLILFSLSIVGSNRLGVR